MIFRLVKFPLILAFLRHCLIVHPAGGSLIFKKSKVISESSIGNYNYSFSENNDESGEINVDSEAFVNDESSNEEDENLNYQPWLIEEQIFSDEGRDDYDHSDEDDGGSYENENLTEGNAKESIFNTEEEKSLVSKKVFKDLKFIKDIWKSKMIAPPNENQVSDLLQELQKQQKKLFSYAPINSKDNSKGSSMVYKLLLAELVSDGGILGGLSGRWVDRDTLLQLKGTAALAQHPQYLKHTAFLPRVSRGIRLVAPTSTHSMQASLAKAVAHATGANFLKLDSKALHSIITLAMDMNDVKSQKGSKVFTTSRLISLLLESADELSHPLVIFISNKGTGLFKNAEACSIIASEMNNKNSRVLFILSSTGEDKIQANEQSSRWSGSNRKMGERVSSEEMKNQDFSQLFTEQNQQGESKASELPPEFPPPEVIQKMMKDALKNAGMDSSGKGNGNSLPPAVVQMLNEALSSEKGKQMLKNLSKGQQSTISFTFVKQPMPNPHSPESAQNDHFHSHGHIHDTDHTHDHSHNEIDANNGSLNSWLSNLKKNMSNRENQQIKQNSFSNSHSQNYGKEQEGQFSTEGNQHFRQSNESPSFKLANMFEDIVINPPSDTALRQHWDSWVEDDVSRHNTRRNREALRAALDHNDLSCPEVEVKKGKLDALIGRHRLTEEETGEVVLASLKTEVARAASCSPILAETDSNGKLIISWRSLETAFASVCKAYVARPGQPLLRTREEVTALAQADRHEAALVTNVILPKDIGVTYSMIGGLVEAKELLRQCITYPLKFPHLYSEGIAREAVKGVLLFGPPGTGKTMLAKAVATEGGATFLSIDASAIENKWLGESEKNARAVFTLARRLAPCVIYLDEVDSVLSSREKYDDSTHGTLTSVKTTIMQEWDGLRTTGDRVVVIASTNRPFDLDEAVLRRLPRRIMVDLPDAETREEILRVTMAGNRVDPSVDFAEIAKELEGFTGSDIKEVCREAVVRIAHEKAQELEQQGSFDEIDLTSHLRNVCAKDFEEARKRMTTSVSEKGRELSRVWDWNEEYGEIKKKGGETPRHNLAMYL